MRGLVCRGSLRGRGLAIKVLVLQKFSRLSRRVVVMVLLLISVFWVAPSRTVLGPTPVSVLVPIRFWARGAVG